MSPRRAVISLGGKRAAPLFRRLHLGRGRALRLREPRLPSPSGSPSGFFPPSLPSRLPPLRASSVVSSVLFFLPLSSLSLAPAPSSGLLQKWSRNASQRPVCQVGAHRFKCVRYSRPPPVVSDEPPRKGARATGFQHSSVATPLQMVRYSRRPPVLSEDLGRKNQAR